MAKQTEGEEKKQAVWYKTWWGVLVVIFLILPFFLIWQIWAKTKWGNVAKVIVTLLIIGFYAMVFSSGGYSTPTKTTDNKATTEVTKTLTPEEQAIKDADDAASKKVADEAKAKQEAENKAKTEADAKAKAEAEAKANAPAEYKSALSQATTYANTMHLSKQGVYDQLVSEYGGKFSAVAAQYGIDNVVADWNANALSQAKTYQDTMHLSPAAVRDQLVSQYGGKFTAAEANYAIQHLND